MTSPATPPPGQDFVKRMSAAFWTLVGTIVVGMGLVLYIVNREPAGPDPAEVAAAANAALAQQEEIIDGKDAISGLIADEGYLTVRSRCTYCHAGDLITQNRATYEGWQSTIRWMQETQNLPDLGDDEPIILTYLAKNYGPDENQGRRKQLKNIEWYVLE